MQNKNQKTTELSSAELLEMFQVEELDDRLEMCWFNCSENNCTINSSTTNTTCCGDQSTGSPSVGVPVNGSCGPANTTPGTK